MILVVELKVGVSGFPQYDKQLHPRHLCEWPSRPSVVWGHNNISWSYVASNLFFDLSRVCGRFFYTFTGKTSCDLIQHYITFWHRFLSNISQNISQNIIKTCTDFSPSLLFHVNFRNILSSIVFVCVKFCLYSKILIPFLYFICYPWILYIFMFIQEFYIIENVLLLLNSIYMYIYLNGFIYTFYTLLQADCVLRFICEIYIWAIAISCWSRMQ